MKIKTDSQFKAKCRNLQNEYRINVLKETEMGFGPYKNSKARLGNILINGEESGKNFISNETFLYAKQKVRDKIINSCLTIDEYRLFNNMLSSMSMCFNLFADLRANLNVNPSQTTEIIKILFKEIEWLNDVKYIDIEFIPAPIEYYTNDKSAFDAVIIGTDKKGKKGIISIETKYTDLLGLNSSKNNKLKNELIKKHKIFTDDYFALLQKRDYRQIDRNYLLTYAFAKRNKFKYYVNLTISPEEDSESVYEINRLKNALRKNKDSILKISLEEIVSRGRNINKLGFGNLMVKFHNRYLIW
ncbi:MAG: hypothetical protein H6609_17870 [Ignavibacteriales bacterium]|nr:hypothetical protein [Ignavibacteriales bacterium]